MILLDQKSLHLISGGETESGYNTKQGAQIGSYLGLVAGTIQGIKASGFAFATYEYAPFVGWCLVSAGQGSYLGLAGMAATGAFLGFWGGALLGGAAMLGYSLHSTAYNALHS